MKIKKKPASKTNRSDEHASAIAAYVDAYRNYLLMWASFITDSAGPTLQQLEAEIGIYIDAREVYLRSEALLILDSCSGVPKEVAQRLFGAIDATIRAHRRYLVEMAGLASRSPVEPKE